MEISDIPESTEPVVNFPINNDPVTLSNKLGYRTRSGRMSKLNLQFYYFSFYKGKNVIYINCIL